MATEQKPRFRYDQFGWIGGDDTTDALVGHGKRQYQRTLAPQGPVFSPAALADTIKLRLQIAELTRENAALKKAAGDNAVSILNGLVSATTELFGSEATVYTDCDPEYPDDKYTVVAVTTTLSPEDAMEVQIQWITATEILGLRKSDIRLCLRMAE